jgi:hypothetical protein
MLTQFHHLASHVIEIRQQSDRIELECLDR